MLVKRVFSEEHKRKISEANKGREVSLETRKKLSLIFKSKLRPKEIGIKISNSLKGRKLSEKHRERISNTLIGRKHNGSCICMTCKAKKGEYIGKNNPSYIDGRTSITRLIRHLDEYFQWRNQILKRDNYTCRECFKRGGKLEAHHKKQFSKLLKEFLDYYNQFSPIEDKEVLVRLAINWMPFWDLSNGETICENCHGNIKVKFK